MGTPYNASGQPQTATLTSYYFGGAYEVTGSSIKKYYSFGGQTIMRDANGLQYFLTDQLGSIVAVTNATGTLISEQRYLPFGGERTNIGAITQTDFGYTGQRKLDSGMGGLMDYKARFYSPYINRFLQPDSLIPDPSNPQAWNRFSYVMNRPVNFNDPTGHMPSEGCGDEGKNKCHASEAEITLNKRRENEFRMETNRRKCEGGNKNYCGESTAKILGFAVTALVVGVAAETFILGGGAAGAVEALPSLAENGFRQGAIMCLKNPLCARVIGAGQGVTVLGKIINGEEPPGYVKIAEQVKGRSLYVDNFTRTVQEQFWNETKALGNPVLLANDYTKYPGSTFYSEVTDLVNSGWTIVLNILVYPPK